MTPAILEPIMPLSATEDGAEFITVNVGKTPKQSTFTIHKNLLAQSSPYFHGAINDGFKGSDGVLNVEPAS
jgi:hypothetical protein